MCVAVERVQRITGPKQNKDSQTGSHLGLGTQRDIRRFLYSFRDSSLIQDTRFTLVLRLPGVLTILCVRASDSARSI
jgi:hypothetical protein